MDGGMLSQDEINALLNGMDISDNKAGGDAGQAPESGGGTDTDYVAIYEAAKQ